LQSDGLFILQNRSIAQWLRYRFVEILKCGHMMRFEPFSGLAFVQIPWLCKALLLFVHQPGK